MRRVALYARFSTDLQRDASIDDQFRVCRARAEAEGWEVVETYADRAISGATKKRPALDCMLSDARSGKFDIVLSEALDRLSRNQVGVAEIYETLQYLDIPIVTLSEGEVNELHIGLKGTMNASQLKEQSRKTHRGLEGRALAGKNAGGKCYGYDIVRKVDGAGNPIRGDRTINEAEAAIVVRIYEEAAINKSPRKIAFDLNKEGVPGPMGRGWSASTIYGNRRRGIGIINNELYTGVLIWNRQRFKKNPDTGRRIARMNPPELWKRVEVPELRIVDQELWDRVKAVQAAIEFRENGMPKEKRPPRMFSYLIKCGECGGGCSMISATHYGCSTARNKGTCSNRLGYDAAKLEERVLAALRSRLMNPELCEAFCKEYTAHINRLRMANNAAHRQYQSELERTDRAIRKLIEAIKDGCNPRHISGEINGLERRKDELTLLLENTPEAPVFIHPRMADRYHMEVQRLIEALQNPEHREESVQVTRGLIKMIVLTPNAERSALSIDLMGDLAGILQISEKHAKGFAFSPRRLSNAQMEEVQQVHAVAGSVGVATLPETFISQQVGLVAGVGFEPTTFRL